MNINSRLSPLAGMRWCIAVLLALLSVMGVQAGEGRVKIYILAGQSNMTELHSTKWLTDNHPELAGAIPNVCGSLGGKVPFRRDDRWGVETPFVAKLAKGVEEPVFIFKSAQGGTTLHSDWRPPSTVKREGGEVGYLYNRLIRRFHNMVRNIEELCPPARKHGSEVAGFEKPSPYVSASKAGKLTAPGDGFEWHHVVGVYDGEQGTMRAWVDAGFGDGTNPKNWATDIPGRGIMPSEAPLTIQSCSRSKGQPSAIDEIAIWNRPLTDDEIKALYNNGNGVEF